MSEQDSKILYLRVPGNLHARVRKIAHDESRSAGAQAKVLLELGIQAYEQQKGGSATAD